MLGDEVGQAIKHGVQGGGLGTKQGLQNTRILHQAMQVNTQHVARRVLPGQALAHHGKCIVTSLGHGGVLRSLPVVDFVALHRHIGQTGPITAPHLGAEAGLCTAHGFIDFKHRDQGQQAQARCVAVNAVRVDQRLPQHLQAATNAQHRTTLPRMPRDACIQALLAQPGQVAAGVFGTRQDDPVVAAQWGQFFGIAHPLQLQPRHIVEWLKLVQIADPWIGHDGDGFGGYFCAILSTLAKVGRGVLQRLVRQTVFFWQAMLPPHGQHRYRGHTGQVFQHVRRRCQQCGVTAELVEHKAFEQAALLRGQQCPRAIQVRKRAAPVNVGYQQASGVAVQCHPHVHDVAGAQVDLGR